MTAYVNQSERWEPVQEIYVKSENVWVPVIAAWVNQDGVWHALHVQSMQLPAPNIP